MRAFQNFQQQEREQLKNGLSNTKAANDRVVWKESVGAEETTSQRSSSTLPLLLLQVSHLQIPTAIKELAFIKLLNTQKTYETTYS